MTLSDGFLHPEQEHFTAQYLGYPSGYDVDRARQARKLDRLIGHTGFDQSLSTPDMCAAFVDELSGDDFVHLLNQMNGIFVNLPRSYRGFARQIQVSGELGDLPVDIHPTPEDKIALLHEVLNVAKTVPDLTDKACLLAVGINAVHPFAEGNGRVARAVYYLLTNGYHPQDQKLQAVLGEHGEDIITPDPNLVRPTIMGNLKLRLGTHELAQSGIPTPKLHFCISDPKFNPFNSLRGGQQPTERDLSMAGIFLQEDYAVMLPMLIVNFFNSLATLEAISEHQGKMYFSLSSFWERATNEDMDNYYAVFREIKNNYVRALLHQLTLGEQSWPMLAPNDRGELEQWPLAVLMKAVVSGDADMSAATVRERLERHQNIR